MTSKIQYTTTYKRHTHAFAFLRTAARVLVVLLLVANTCLGKEDPEYDEISVFISVQGVGSIEVPAVISNEVAYLAVSNVFDFLKIRNSLSPGLDSVSGLFINLQTAYLIDHKNHRIVCGETIFQLKGNETIRTETNLYLRADYFGQAFGLKCVFNFRSLTVKLTTTLELPVIREMRQEAMRSNMRRLTGTVKRILILVS